MKFVKHVQVPDVEVQIEICGDDLYELFSELNPSDRESVILYHLNNIGKFMRAIPEETIAEMKPMPRKLLRDFFEQQSKRFATESERVTP